MKPFITEEQLLNLKYNSDNKEYYGKNLADIFLQKLREYSEVNDINFSEFDIEKFIQHFFHRKIHKGCQVKFIDGSSLYFYKFKKNEMDLYGTYRIKTSDYSDDNPDNFFC